MFIDTTSFEILRTGRPWAAYRQFCQHFLSPLALMSLRDVRLDQLSRLHVDGVPLDLASELLPGRARAKPGLAMPIRMHTKSQSRHEADAKAFFRIEHREPVAGSGRILVLLEPR